MGKLLIPRRTILKAAALAAPAILISRPAFAAYLGPGDIVGSAGGFWGTRAYNAAYAAGLGNCMNVVSNAGGVISPTTIQVTATGEANLSQVNAAITNAGGSVPIRCSQLYDQSGNGFHLTSTGGTSTLPTVTVAPTGLLATRVALTFTAAASQNLGSLAFGAHAQPLTLTLFQLRTTTSQATASIGSNPAIGMLGANTGVMYGGTLCSSSGSGAGSVAENAWNSFSGLFTTTLSFYVNGAAMTLSPTNPGTGAPTGASGFLATNASLDGMIAEMGYWPSGWTTGNQAAWGNPASGNPNDGSVTFFISSGAVNCADGRCGSILMSGVGQ